jgi:TrmH family RNA methyltransferase
MTHTRHLGGTRFVTSLQNETVKFVRSLEMRKVRRETGLFVAEGTSVLLTARDRGASPQTLLLQPGAGAPDIEAEVRKWAQDAGAEIVEVSHAVLAKVASKENPQSTLGIFAQTWHELPAPAAIGKDATWLALEEIRDPGNLGTIVRTVEAVGAAGLILIGNCCDPYSREAVRATMGSIFSVPLVRTDRDRFLTWRQSWRGDVIGTHLAAHQDFRTADYRGPVLVVMGSERPGLSLELTAACSRLVKIPMAGSIDSLNLAIATALTLYQVRGRYLHLS